MTNIITRLKTLKPLIEQQGHKLDIIRAGRIPVGSYQSLVEKILSNDEAEFFFRGRMHLWIYLADNQCQGDFDELYVRTQKQKNKSGIYTFEIVPFLYGGLQHFLLQYDYIACKNFQVHEHPDSKSGFNLEAELMHLSTRGYTANLASTSRNPSKFSLHVLEKKRRTETKTLMTRTEVYQIITDGFKS